MGCHVIDAALAHNEDFPAIAQRFTVIGTGSHASALGDMAMSPPAIGKLAVVHAFYQLTANDKTERRSISGARLQAGRAAISPDIV
jgi:hypothetical protein